MTVHVTARAILADLQLASERGTASGCHRRAQRNGRLLARFAWTCDRQHAPAEKAYIRQTIIIAVPSMWKICLDSAGFGAVQVKNKKSRPLYPL